MADELSAELELNIKDALASVDDLRDEIEKATKEAAGDFEDQFEKAIGGLPDVEIVADVDKVEPAITGAIADVDPRVEIEAALDRAESALAGFESDVTGLDPSVAVDADTAAAEAALAALNEDLTATLTVEADTGAAEAAIAVLDADLSASVTVEADTGPAEDQVRGLVTETTGTTLELGLNLDTDQAEGALTDLTAAGGETEDSMEGVTAATSAFGAAGGLTSGSIDALTNTVGGLASRAGGLGIAVGGGVIALGGFTNQAVNSLGAAKRLETTFGDLAAGVENIKVGNLNTSLKDLALNTGSSGSAMRNAASDAFLLQTSYGKGREEAAKYAEQLLAVAGRAVALNPALGETGEVATRLSRAFQSGRDRALQPYNLGITSLEINTRAASIAEEDHRKTVTQADKAMAGASLSVEKLGGHLKQDIAEGAENPILALRKLTKEFASLTTEFGKPLVAPVLDLLEKSKPIVEAFGRVLLQLAQSALPVVAAALDALGPSLSLIADMLEVIPGPAKSAAVALGLIVALQGPISTALTAIGSGMLSVATAAEGLGAAKVASGVTKLAQATGTAATGVAGMGAAIGSVALPVGLAIGATALLTLGLRELIGTSGTIEIKIDDLADVSFPKLVKRIQEFNTYFTGSTTVLKRVDGSFREVKGTAEELQNTMFGASAFNQREAAKAQFDRFNEVLDKSPQFAQKYIDAAKAAGVNTETWSKKLKNQVDAAAESSRAQELLNTAVSVAEDVYGNATESLDLYRFGIGSAEQATSDMSAAVARLKGELDLLLGNYVSSEEAQGRMEKSIRDLNVALFLGETSIEDYQIRSSDASLSLLSMAKSAEQTALAVYTQTHNVEESIGPLVSYRDQLIELRRQLQEAGLDTHFIDSLLRQVDGAIQGIKDKTPPAKEAGGEFGQSVTDGATDGMSGLPPAASAAATGASAAVLDTAPQFDEAGRVLGVRTATGLYITGEQIANAGRTIAAAGYSAIESTASDWNALGYALGIAVSNGLDRAQSRAGASAIGIAQYALEQAKAYGYIQSPSKLWRDELGVPFGEGIAVGIASTGPQIARATIGVTKPGVLRAGSFGAPRGALAGVGAASDRASSTHTAIQFNINVSGVTSPATGRAVGEQIGEGASEALARRGYTTVARFG